jgi:hypothetical protein
MQRLERVADQVERGGLHRRRSQLAAARVEIGLGRAPKGERGACPALLPFPLRVVPERDAGEEQARGLARLRIGEPVGGADGLAPGAAVDEALRHVGAPNAAVGAAAQPHTEPRVPEEFLVLALGQGEPGDGPGVQLRSHSNLSGKSRGSLTVPPAAYRCLVD